MPRKPRSQSRTPRTTHHRPAGESLPRAASPVQASKLYYQCLACGAPTDPMFGAGDASWCPSCKQCGEICCAKGELPDPSLYGKWVEQTERKRAEAKEIVRAASSADTAQGSASLPFNPLQSANGVTTMKQPKLHTGIYSCLECCIEFDLNAEESLKCDRCGGQLIRGSLDDFEQDDDDERE